MTADDGLAKLNGDAGGATEAETPAEFEQGQAELEAASARLERTRRELERLARRQRVLMDELRAAREAGAELDRFRNSTLFRAAYSYRSIVERLAPPASGRRRLYGKAVSELARLRRPRPQDSERRLTKVELPPLPTSEAPEASVVIPVHNNVELTTACLQSIAQQPQAVPFEVIIVDDASGDDTAELLAGVRGGRVVRLDQNQGFAGAVNAGIAATHGRYIVLLNNDTTVSSGWLDELVEAAEAWPGAGIVGAKLVYPDGRLQEAGGIIWSDGNGWNYGRGDDPEDLHFNFVREVDYCSGACLLIRRGLLTAVGGGLDSQFAPAYYEDTDLAFAARRLGYRVLYQPAAVVHHAEGASHGTDVTAGYKRFQELNRRVFREKWWSELGQQRQADPRNVRAASWRSRLGRVLVIDHWVPMPDRDSGSRRMFELLCLLADLGFAVSFVPDDDEVRPEYARPLQRRGIEVLGGQRDLLTYLQDVGPELRAAILVRPPIAARHLDTLRDMAPTATVIYDTVDLHFLREMRRAEVENDSALHRAADDLRQAELALADRADSSFVVSPVERQLVLDHLPDARVYVIPNIHRDAEPGPPFHEREGLLFVGGFAHPPNSDAVGWLVREVMPLVLEKLPDLRVFIAGSDPTDEILALADPSVEVLGWVPSLAELYDRARVFVAPLRYGAGMKGKVGESLAHGLPVVTTRIGGEGMGLEHGHDVLVADDAAGFAAEVVRAYEDGELWRQLSYNGRRTMADRFSPRAVSRLLVEALDDLGVLDQPPLDVEASGVDVWG